MNDSRSIEKLWNDFLNSLPETHHDRFCPLPEAWSFGNDKRLADELANLVIIGRKTATCSRYRGGNILDEGGLSIIIDGDRIPQCVVETYEVTIRRYRDVDAGFAADEGEGDQSLEYWRKAHWEFFTREGEMEGYAVSDNMPLACERFRVVFVNPNIRSAVQDVDDQAAVAVGSKP
ncbi:MAG: ASCH domain-containing protein [Planctomycetales bacterium]